MLEFTDEIFSESTRRRHARLWMFSDLQQSVPAYAERYFRAAMEDFELISSPIDGICYLGDASEGSNLEDIHTMIRMQMSFLDALDTPVYYSIGNHELDYYRHCLAHGLPPSIPFYDAVKNKPNWHLIPDQEQFWFAEELPEFTLLFFSDHASKTGDWYAFHEHLPDPNGPYGFKGQYPYTKEDWLAVRDRFGAQDKPVFTFSHCAFPGGNRPSEFLAQMLPLPRNFRAHFHGHAHIGDAQWAGCTLYRQIAAVNGHPILQFDISSLDHRRGTTVRSAFFDYYGDGQYGVFFRDHINHRWEQFFLSAYDAQSAGIPEKFTEMPMV